MGIIGKNRRRFRPWRLLLACLCLAGVCAWLVAAEFRVRRDFERGKAALAADEPAAARSLIDRYLASRPGNAEAHFRAAQAARRCGDLVETERHLVDAEQLGWSAADIELERALVQAQSGDLSRSESLLLAELHDGQSDPSQIFAVMVPAYIRDFRLFDALRLARQWSQAKPNSAPAWSCLGAIFERLRKKNDALNAFREAVRLDPDNRHYRLALARMQVETRLTGEAAENLDWLARSDPNDPEVIILLGLCREADGSTDQAAALFDRVIAEHSNDAKAFYQRGRLDLHRGRPASGIPYLRRASELDASDPEILYSLLLCLQQAGTPEEIRQAEARWKQCDADLKRVGEVARLVAASPHDPDLRREIGELFLRNGRDAEGLRWLESALREQPDHEPSHWVLADYYERKGRPIDAAFHRTFIQLTNRP